MIDLDGHFAQGPLPFIARRSDRFKFARRDEIVGKSEIVHGYRDDRARTPFSWTAREAVRPDP